MRNTKLLALLVISACMLTVVPVMAKKGGVTLKANGKLTHYPNVNEDPASIILKGSWDLKIKDDVAEFGYYYQELNIYEEYEYSPAGTIDHFRGTLEVEGYQIYEDHVEVWGQIHVDKKMWFLDDYPDPLPWWYPEDRNENAPVDWIRPFIVQDCYIYVYPDEIFLDNGVFGDINIYGTTTTYHD
jgi:hypothetical protein